MRRFRGRLRPGKAFPAPIAQGSLEEPTPPSGMAWTPLASTTFFRCAPAPRRRWQQATPKRAPPPQRHEDFMCLFFTFILI